MKMGICVVVKNPMGEVFVMLQAPKYNIIDPTIVESIEALRVAVLIRELGLQKVELKESVLLVVQILRKDDKN